jgi:hypothetical protein
MPQEPIKYSPYKNVPTSSAANLSCPCKLTTATTKGDSSNDFYVDEISVFVAMKY